jgi:hypothetical protein
MKKTTEKLLPRTIVRLIFYALICRYIYLETGIVTTALLACILLENAIYADHSDALHRLVTIVSEKTTELMEFQNEYILPRLTKKKDICPICEEIIPSKTNCVNCTAEQHTACMVQMTDGIICRVCADIEDVRKSLEYVKEKQCQPKR